MKCTLCKGITGDFLQGKEREFVRCENCRAILLLPEYFLDFSEEQGRYLQHNNDVTDPRYKEFLSPVINQIRIDFSKNSKGLDFGCGTGPVAAVELRKLGFHVNLYDPFFENHPQALEETYDYIICSEVMEHFHQPFLEFSRLYNMLNPGGKLYCKTVLYNDELNFKDWYYKNDPTHVFLYTEESLQWIKENFNYKKLEVSSKLIVFEK